MQLPGSLRRRAGARGLGLILILPERGQDRQPGSHGALPVPRTARTRGPSEGLRASGAARGAGAGAGLLESGPGLGLGSGGVRVVRSRSQICFVFCKVGGGGIPAGVSVGASRIPSCTGWVRTFLWL